MIARSRSGKYVVSAPVLEQLAEPLAREAGRRRPCAVRVAFLPNETLRRLKRIYLKKTVRFVDVLAFPEPAGLPHPESKKPVLGDIYLNATFRAHPRIAHLMFIHGFLHLLGFSHAGKRDTMKMERLEKKLYAWITRRTNQIYARRR
jgi:rRNA maturation RNase YbeY